MHHDVTRRKFIELPLAASVASVACGGTSAQELSPRSAAGTAATRVHNDAANSMPTRELGSTGVRVSLVGLGGFHIGKVSDEETSIRMMHSAVDRGVTFFDNCWDYNEGRSEERMGKALQSSGYRDRVFLMTKIDGRTKTAAAAQIDQSLKRLRTDRIDLIQIHEVIRPTDPARCFDDGCVQALLDAKKAGKLRFIGFTGHKDPSIHLAMLEAADAHQFRFDTVQMPLNVMDAHYASFEKRVLPVLVAKKIGVLGMKSLGAGKILKSKTATAIECLHYAMNLPTSVVITGCDSMPVLDQAIEAAKSFKPLPEAEVAALLARTKDAAKDGEFEAFKNTDEHDGTIKQPKWLEKAEL